jgi:hypothetical protein
MQPCSENAVFEWIQHGRVAFQPRSEGQQWQARVCNLIPPTFKRYAKVLHRLDAHYENIDQPLSQPELAILHIPDCAPVRDFVETKRKTSPTTRVLWKEAAESLNVPFRPEINHQWFVERLRPHPECWPRFIYGPAEGGLEDEECSELVRVLAPFTPSGECFVRFSEIPLLGTDAPLLFDGHLDEIKQLAEPYHFTPEYWWPANQSWCLCSDYDLDFTIIGGDAQLVEALLRNEVLESIEVTSNTRIDSFVTMPEI